MKSKKVQRAKRYERQKAKQHRGKHLGGPGQPDYTRGKKKGEVKNWDSRKITKPELEKLIKKGIKEVVSKSGFTQPAIELAKRKKIKLFHKKKKVT